MADGTVKWFDPRRGFGVIIPDDLTHTVFVHYSAIEGSGFRSLSEGQRVRFDAQPGIKGPQATWVSAL